MIDVVAERIAKNRYEEGALLAHDKGNNTLDDLIPVFTFGNDKNLLDRKKIII